MTSVLSVVFLLGAAMHFSLAPLYIFMPSAIMGGRPNRSIHPAIRHFLAILGAAHGGFAAQLVAAAFLPNEVRALFGCICLLGYAVMGPIAEGLALERPPTLWDCLSCCFSSSRGFADADKDGDGYLTEEEWRAAQAAGAIPRSRKWSRVIAELDTDSDGRVSLAEFKRLKNPSLNFPVVVAILLLGMVSDTGLSRYTLAAGAIVALGLLIFGAIAFTKTEACRKRRAEDGADEESDDEGEEGGAD